MEKFFKFCLVIMLLALTFSAQAQAEIPNLPVNDAWRAAVADLGSRLGLNLNAPQTTFTYIIETVSDTALGCTIAKEAGFASNSISPPIRAYFLTVNYNDKNYEYRVTNHNDTVILIPCDLKLLTPAAPTPATTGGTCNIVADTEGVKIRKGASLEHPQIGALPAGVVKAVNNQSPDGQWLWLVEGGWVAKVSVRVTAGDCNALPTSTYVAELDVTCPPLPARLYNGARGRVTAGGVGNSFSSKPQADSVITEIPPLGEFTVVGSPQCDPATGIAWWPVEYNGRTGWTPQGDPLSGEYWVEPVPGQAPAPTAQPTAVTSGALPSGACTVMRRADTFGSLRTKPTIDTSRAGFICPREVLTATAQSTDGEWLLTGMGWVKKSIVELSGVCSGLPTSSAEFPAPGTAGQCPPGTALVNLTVGSNGQVVDNGYPNDVLTQPRDLGTGGVAFVGQIPSGATFQVTGGPMCDQTGMVWWEVKYNNISGWTAQGIERCGQGWWLKPAQGTATTVYTEGASGSAPPAVPSGGAAPQNVIIANNVANLTNLGTVEVPGDRITGLAWLPQQNAFFISTENGEIKLIGLSDLAEKPLPMPMVGHTIAVSADQRYVVTQGNNSNNPSCGNKSIMLYDLETSESAELACDPGIVANNIAIQPKNWWIAVSSGNPGVTTEPVENAILYITLSDRSVQKSLTADPVRAVQISPDGNLTGILDTATLQVWHTANPDISPLSVSTGVVSEDAIYQMGGGLAFAPSGTAENTYMLAVIDQMEIQIVQVTKSVNAFSSQNLVTIPPLSDGSVPVHVAFSIEASVLAVGYRSPGDSYQTQFYATGSGQALALANGIQAFSFNPSGTLLATFKTNGALELYGIK